LPPGCSFVAGSATGLGSASAWLFALAFAVTLVVRRRRAH
jgi:MYXO-CTERM domain-containing protein